MLFNSVEFIFGFFPIAALVFSASRAGAIRRQPRVARVGLAVLLRLVELGLRAAAGRFGRIPTMSAAFILRDSCAQQHPCRGRVARFARSAPISLLLGYFKYANFFLGVWGSVTGNASDIGEIILPLGISFFTFTQIAFLVDVYRGYVKEYNFDPLRVVRHLFSAPDRRARSCTTRR